MGRLMVMEQQSGPGGQTYLLRSPRPGEMSLWAFQSIAHGADGMVHFRWRTARTGAEEYWYGVLDHDNIPRARFQEFRKEGEQLRRIGNEILGSRLNSDIAVIKDYDAEWVFDHQYQTAEINLGQEFRELFQAASEMKFNVDFIGPQADFSRYKLIVGPQGNRSDSPDQGLHQLFLCSESLGKGSRHQSWRRLLRSAGRAAISCQHHIEAV